MTLGAKIDKLFYKNYEYISIWDINMLKYQKYVLLSINIFSKISYSVIFS